MKIQKTVLIEDLKDKIQNAKEVTQSFMNLEPEALNFKSDSESWSILECIEHLNRYGKFYLPEIEKSLLNAPEENYSGLFRSGWLGNYFVNMIRPENRKKMKTVKEMDTSGSELNISVLHKFNKQLDTLLFLLDKSKNADLNKAKTAISIMPVLKLKLGDILQFLVYHIERHMNQALDVRKKINEKQGQNKFDIQ